MSVRTIKTHTFAVWSHPPAVQASMTCSNEEDTYLDRDDELDETLPVLLPFAEAEARFLSLTTIDYSAARDASNEERKTIQGGMRMQALVYGEVTFLTMRKILDRVFSSCFKFPSLSLRKRIENLEFVDLGSGAGRPTLSSACHFPFRRCVGVELLDSLHQLALKSKRQWDEQDVPPRTEVCFFRGDMFDTSVYDWRKTGDIILVNSTCFSKNMLADLAKIAQDVSDTCVIITFTLLIESPYFELITTDRFEMSWGAADVYYHKRRVETNQQLDN